MFQYNLSWYVKFPVSVEYAVYILVGIGCAVAIWFYEFNDGISTSKAAFILFIGETM
jgi:multidrug transporter EmrE-like cation transporter